MMVTIPPPPGKPGAGVRNATGLQAPSPQPFKAAKQSVAPEVWGYVLLASTIILTLMSLATLVFAGTNLNLRLIGYVLGGILGPVVLGLNTVLQRNALRDPNFIPSQKLNVAIRLIVFLGIASAIVQVIFAGELLSQFISEALLRAGWQI